MESVQEQKMTMPREQNDAACVSKSEAKMELATDHRSTTALAAPHQPLVATSQKINRGRDKQQKNARTGEQKDAACVNKSEVKMELALFTPDRLLDLLLWILC